MSKNATEERVFANGLVPLEANERMVGCFIAHYHNIQIMHETTEYTTFCA